MKIWDSVYISPSFMELCSCFRVPCFKCLSERGVSIFWCFLCSDPNLKENAEKPKIILCPNNPSAWNSKSLKTSYSYCEFNSVEFILLNFNQIFTSCQTTFKTNKSNRTKVGIISLVNRLHSINDKIPLDWLRLSMESFKLKCKELFFWL